VDTVKEVTAAVLAGVEGKIAPEKGDLLALTVKDLQGQEYVFGSFHGDTDGLATVPTTTALHKLSSSSYPGHRLVFALDANTYEKGKPGKQQGVTEFAAAFRDMGLTSHWGAAPDAKNHTTCNARTYLQPQLNKAVGYEQRATAGDTNCKDYILFGARQYIAEGSTKDNTGRKHYINQVFPTLEFPSDHAVVATDLVPAEPHQAAL